MQKGDKVRFLSEKGGGIVAGFQGKDIVLVEDEDGFQIPMPIRECVVIDTDDYNIAKVNTMGRKTHSVDKGQVDKLTREPYSAATSPSTRQTVFPSPEIKGNDILNVKLAYVPQDIKAVYYTINYFIRRNFLGYLCHLFL